MKIKDVLHWLRDAHPRSLGITGICVLFRWFTEISVLPLPSWMRLCGFFLSLLCVMLILILFRE